MNQHALDVLEYDKIRELLVSYTASGLGARLAQRIQPLTDLHRIESADCGDDRVEKGCCRRIAICRWVGCMISLQF